MWISASCIQCYFFSPWKKKVPVKTVFFRFLDFFTGKKCFSRTLFSVFFTHTFFFHGHDFCIFSRVEYFVSRAEFSFFSRVGVFFTGTNKITKEYFLTPTKIECIDIFLKHNYDFFHAHFFDFHGHIFFKFSRAKNLFSRTQTHKIFTATFVFSRALLLIFFTGGTPIFTGKKNNTACDMAWVS